MEVTKQTVAQHAQQVIAQVRQAIVGKDPVLLWAFAAFLSGGHILMEDIPGVGKTTMAVAFSKVLGLRYNRVQFTPDVLPSDITGFSVLEQSTGDMTYKPGAIMCNLFLADELNRATSRTQSALLEAMEEGQVTVDGIRHDLPKPFIVIATQNPTGAAGTQPLPDSQMDRFSIRMSLGYPAPADEKTMVLQRMGSNPLNTLTPLLTCEDLEALQAITAATFVHEDVVDYIVALIDATRHHPDLARGASPRATLSVTTMSKAIAQLNGRDFVTPKDVQEVFLRIIPHRLHLSAKAENSGITAEKILQGIVGKIAAPALR